MTLNKTVFTFGLAIVLSILASCTQNDTPATIITENVSLAPTPTTSTAPITPKKATSPYVLPGDALFMQFPLMRPATGKKVVVVDPNIPAWAAYDENGNLVKTGRASAGRDYCPDEKKSCRTVTGTYAIYSKGGAKCKSTKFPLATHGGAPMPYCMHFYKGYALHGSYEMEDYDASHGCVRMVPSSAQWLNQHFAEVGTTVIILPYKTKDTHA